MYADTNPKSKKELKRQVADGELVHAYQPGGMFPGTTDGEAFIEGPHYPKPHSFYAKVLVKDKRIVKVLG